MQIGYFLQGLERTASVNDTGKEGGENEEGDWNERGHPSCLRKQTTVAKNIDGNAENQF